MKRFKDLVTKVIYIWPLSVDRKVNQQNRIIRDQCYKPSNPVEYRFVRTGESSLSFGISKIAQSLPFSFIRKQIFSLTLPTFAICSTEMIMYRYTADTSLNRLRKHSYIVEIKINANMDIRIWVFQAFVKRFLSCNLSQRKLLFSSWVGFCERNNHVHKFSFAWVSEKNILIEKGRKRPQN